MEWTFTQNLDRDSTTVDFTFQSAVQQCNLFRNESVALAPRNGFASSQCFDVIVRRDVSVQLREML